MKKTLLLAFVCAALAACGKDDPIDLPKPAPEQQKESGNAENSDSDNPTPNPDQPDSGQPDPAPTVTQEEMATYFGFGYEDVNKAIARTRTAKGVQKIGDKNIEVTKTDVKSKDETAGSFVLHLEGKVNDKAFEATLTFDGFAKRPDNYNMGKRVQGKWKADGADKYAKFDLDYLLRQKKTDKFTAQYLSEAIEFYSTDFDGKPFYYTEEDIRKSVISDMQYISNDGGEISFNLTYSGAKSGSPIRLAIDKNIYYAGKVTVNADFSKKLYVRGVAENYLIFGGSAVEYDKALYVVQCVGADGINESEGKLTLKYNLMINNGSDEPLASFSKEIKGFKPLRELKNELELHITTELSEFMKKKLDKKPLGDVKAVINPSLQNWVKHILFEVKRGGNNYVLEWTDTNKTSLRSGEGLAADVYLDHPRFELLSADLGDNNGTGPKMLSLKLKLVSVSDVSLSDDDVTFSMGIHIPSN
ncbi:LptM family lipoprotein [Bacteroides pyogenes]|uniref:LptM family lipoprotein n=1 Tax=Bacteroides pyogenes TaxID=310300 RepID=UPI003FA1682F